MSLAKKAFCVSVVLLGLGLSMGCPTLPDSVSGRSADEVDPGDLIEWPARQIDPTGEDTAGFNQVVSADMNGDGLVDLVTAAYESQPIQVHLQQRGPDGAISFRSFSVAGSGPIVQVSELRVADMDQDGNLDIIMSILDTGFVPSEECAIQQGAIVILFAPPDPSDSLDWEEVNLTRHFQCELIDQIPFICEINPQAQECCLVDPSQPDCEISQEPVVSSISGFGGNERTYASIDVADVNDDGFPDILAAFNGCDGQLSKQVELWINPADDRIRQNELEVGDPTKQDSDGDGKEDSCQATVDSPWQRLLLQVNNPDIASARFSDVDLDGDLDVVALRPDSTTFDITWQINPLIPFGEVTVDLWSSPQDHPIGESDAGFDFVEIGDLDGDGFSDVLTLGQADGVLRWFRRPLDPVKQDFPWEVFNMVQYSTLVPTAMEITDVDADGQLDVVAAAGGHLRWFTPLGASPFDPWSEQFVVTDPAIGNNSSTVGSSPFFPINSVHAVDIDGDGRLDIVATFDRQGTNNDVIVWFQNSEIEDP